MTFEPIDLAAIELASFPDLGVYAGLRERNPHAPTEWGDNYISASALKQFARCPEQFRRRRILGEKEAPAGALITGTAHHRAVETNLAQKIETWRDLPVDDVRDVARDAFVQRVDDAGGPREFDEWEDAPEAKYAEALDYAVNLTSVYHHVGAPRVQPMAVETPFMIRLAGIPAPICGFIDTEADVGDPMALMAISAGEFPDPALYARRIIEHKTAGRESVGPETYLQGWTYQLVRALQVDIHLAVKNKTPKIVLDKYRVELAPRSRTTAIVARAMRTLSHYFAVYGPDEPWPGAFGGWTSVCEYCGFGPNKALTCPWWQDVGWAEQGKYQPVVEAEPDVTVDLFAPVNAVVEREEEDG